MFSTAEAGGNLENNDSQSSTLLRDVYNESSHISFGLYVKGMQKIKSASIVEGGCLTKNTSLTTHVLYKRHIDKTRNYLKRKAVAH